MKVKLTEAQIRALLRERIARRLLMEESPEPQSRPGGISLRDVAAQSFQALGGSFGPLAAGRSPVEYTIYRQKREIGQIQTSVEAIAELTSAPIVNGKFGEGAGGAIQSWQSSYSDWMARAITFSGSEDPLITWKKNYQTFKKVPGFNKQGEVDSSREIDLPDDARGLLAYLYLVHAGAIGVKTARDLVQILKDQVGLNLQIDGWVNTFKISNMMIEASEAIKVSRELLDIVKEDNAQRGCFKTRYALAKFATSNTKYGETNLAKAFDIGMWAVTLATLPQTMGASLGVTAGTGLRAARFASLAEPLDAAVAAETATVAATRARVARQLAAAGEETVAGAERAISAADVAGKTRKFDQAQDALMAARDAAKAAADDLDSSNVFVDDALESAYQIAKKYAEEGTKSAAEIVDEIDKFKYADLIDTKSGKKIPFDEIKDEVTGIVKMAQAESRLKKAQEAEQAAEKAASLLKTELDAAGPLASITPGKAAQLMQRGKLIKGINPKFAYTTMRDYAAASGIPGLLGAITASGISTTALGLLVSNRWAKLFISRDELELLAAMSSPEQLGELADEFTNTFFVDPSVVDGIDEVEDAIYKFAETGPKAGQADLTALRSSLESGIAKASKTPIIGDTDAEEK